MQPQSYPCSSIQLLTAAPAIIAKKCLPGWEPLQIDAALEARHPPSGKAGAMPVKPWVCISAAPAIIVKKWLPGWEPLQIDAALEARHPPSGKAGVMPVKPWVCISAVSKGMSIYIKPLM
jgi:hypothetical protein